MGEWSTYSLGDFLMFSPQAWYRMLELHNRAWWPLQIVAAALGTGLLVTRLMGQGVNLINGDYSRAAAGFWQSALG